MMMTLKDRIAAAEKAAITEESPIAAVFRNPPSLPSTPDTSPAFGIGTARDLPVNLLDEIEQPFRLYNDQKLEQMRESITAHGIIQRIIVRPDPSGNGRYQIISGRNRRRAAILAGYTSVPCEIRTLDDDEAQLQMVTTNLEQRDELLPSEKAKAYRLRLETLVHQGKRTDLKNFENAVNPLGENKQVTSSQFGTKLRSDNLLADSVGESRMQIQRYIRLTYLIPKLLDAVDCGTLGFGAGVSLSYLTAESQSVVHQYFFIDHKQKISGDLAEKIRATEKKDTITAELISHLLSPSVNSKPLRKVSVPMKKIRSYFPAEATPKQIEQQILEIVTAYFQTQEKSG